MFKSTCPVCNNAANNSAIPNGIIKCKACNSFYKPNATGDDLNTPDNKITKKDKKKDSKWKFSIDFSDSDSDVDFAIDIKQVGASKKPSTTKDESNKKSPTKTKATIHSLDFSDSEDEIIEKLPTKATTTNKLFKNYSLDFSDSEDEIIEKLPTKATTTNKSFKKYSLDFSDSEDEIIEKLPTTGTTTNKSSMNYSLDFSDSEDEQPKKKIIPVSKKSAMLFSDSEDEEPKIINKIAKKSTIEPKKKIINKKLVEKKLTMDFSDSEGEEKEIKATSSSNARPSRKAAMNASVNNDAFFTKNNQETINDDDESSSDDMYKPVGQEFSDMELSDEEEATQSARKREALSTSQNDQDKHLKSDNDEKSKKRYKEVIYEKGQLNEKKRKKETLPRSIQKFRAKDNYVPKPTNRFNPYILFNQAYRGKFKELHPGISNLELTKLVATTYNELDPEAKAALIENARSKADEYKKSIPIVVKFPPNAYVLFKNSNSKKYMSEVKDFKGISKLMAQKWRELSPNEKLVYQNESKRKKEEFKQEYPQAYKDMVERRSAKNVATKKEAARKRIFGETNED